MKRDVFGLIYAGENNLNLRELVSLRSIAALPVGGRYRAIDFPLSNMVNTGIKIGVITQRNYHSLMDHIGSGKDWGLNKRNNGLYILPPFDTSENHGTYRGLLDAINGAMAYIRRSQEEYCLLCGSYTLYNTNYEDMIEYHIKSGAEITMLYNVEPSPSGEHFKDVLIDTDENGVVTDMKFNSTMKSGPCKMGMDVYVLKKDLLIYLVEEAISRGRYGLIEDILLPRVSRGGIHGYEYNGYVGRLVSVASYYKVNMDMLNPAVHDSIFYAGNQIFTRIKDAVPAKYAGDSVARNCLIANGCIVEGYVENSVIFRGVHVRKGAVIKDSIVMQGSDVGQDAHSKHVILDKDVLIRDGRRLIGDANFPVIIKKGAVV